MPPSVRHGTGKLDAYSYLEKPVDFDELIHEIEGPDGTARAS